MLLVGLKSRDLRDTILQGSHKTKKNVEFRAVYIDPDLTKAQMEDKAELRREAQRRTESGNGQWRVKGRKGASRLTKIRM
jgi:hypothetical protein